MKNGFICAALAALLAASPAGAISVTPNVVNKGAWLAASITTADQILVGPGSVLTGSPQGVSTFLYLENESASATICVSFGVAATIATSVCSPGEITLGPLAYRMFVSAIPADSIHAIGSAAASLTVGIQ